MARRPLQFAEIKNPFGSFQFSPKADAWWVPLILLSKKLEFLNTLICIIKIEIDFLLHIWIVKSQIKHLIQRCTAVILSVEWKGADLKQTDTLEKRQTSKARCFVQAMMLRGPLWPKHLPLFEIVLFQFYQNLSRTNISTYPRRKYHSFLVKFRVTSSIFMSLYFKSKSYWALRPCDPRI